MYLTKIQLVLGHMMVILKYLIKLPQF